MAYGEQVALSFYLLSQAGLFNVESGRLCWQPLRAAHTKSSKQGDFMYAEHQLREPISEEVPLEVLNDLDGVRFYRLSATGWHAIMPKFSNIDGILRRYTR